MYHNPGAYYPEFLIQDPIDMGYDLIHDMFCISSPVDTGWVRHGSCGCKNTWIFQRGHELMVLHRRPVDEQMCQFVASYIDTHPHRGNMRIEYTSDKLPHDNILCVNDALNEFLGMVRKAQRDHNESLDNC